MAVQSEIFSTEYGVRSFISTKHIATKQHMSVWLQRRSDNIWFQLSTSNYELINNSAVLTQAPNSTIYSQVEIRVADTHDELGSSQSEIAVLAGLYDEIVALNGIKNDITTVAGISGDVTTVSSNILDINSVVTNIVPNLTEILQADTNATIATTKATEASDSATSAASNAAIATNKATIATTKASEASASATSASNSETTATTKASEANASAISASNSSTSASNSATTATTKANEASASASSALASEVQARIYAGMIAISVDTIENMTAISLPQEGQVVVVRDENRGGVFIYRPTGVANGGTIFDSSSTGKWYRQYDGAINVKWFGAKGDEVTDDTVAIQSALTFCSLFGHRLLLSSGIYKITAKLQVSTSTNGFEILGESIDSTILKRGSALCSSVLEVIYADGIHINNFSIDGGYLEFPSYPVDENIGHGVSVGMSSNCVIKNIKVTNYRDSGIYCGHSNLPIGGSPIYGNNLIDNCMCLGNTTANNGIIYVSVRDSGITNCVVKDLKIDGVPAYGIQLKNACHHCWISDCSVFNSRGGFIIGQDQGEFGHIAGLYARLSNLHAKNCIFPYYFGSTVNAMMSNLICETTVEHTGGLSAGVILSGGSSGNNIDISIIGLVGAASLGAARPAVYFEDVSSTVFPSNNSIRVKTLSVTGDVAKTAKFSLYSTNNTVRVVDCLTHNLGYPSLSIEDLSPNTSGNAVIINEATCAVIRQITNDTVIIVSKFVNMVILDTEALAGTDTLSTILGGYNGQKIVFTTTSNARDVTFVTTGNITLNGNAPFSATTVNCRIELMYNSITSKWCEVSRSVNN